jgi:hypothetical protein
MKANKKKKKKERKKSKSETESNGMLLPEKILDFAR